MEMGITVTGRPDRDEWHLRGADWLAEMGDCTRSKVGALIVGPDKRIWGMGYNGSYPGGPSCLAGACPRGLHAEDANTRWVTACQRSARHWYNPDLGEGEFCSECQWLSRCLCGQPWPCPDAVEPGSSYDTGPGTCISTHAEGNAKADAMRRGGGDLAGCVAYISREPCEGCVRDYRNTTKVTAMIWRGGAIGLP